MGFYGLYKLCVLFWCDYLEKTCWPDLGKPSKGGSEKIAASYGIDYWTVKEDPCPQPCPSSTTSASTPATV